MKSYQISSDLFIQNRKRLLPLLEENSLVLVCANELIPRSGDQYYPFRQNSNFFYLCAINRPNVILALCPEHPNPKLREVLFVQFPSPAEALWKGDCFSASEATLLSGIQTVLDMSQYDNALQEMACHSRFIYLDIPECPKLPDAFRATFLRYTQKIKNQFPLHEYKRLNPLLTKLRLYKSTDEVALLQKASRITQQVFDDILPLVTVARPEYEIEAEILRSMLINGATGSSFDPIIASGKNACVLHYNSNASDCQPGELILLDFGAEYAHYAADLSRTLPVGGRFSARQRQVYEACLRVYEAAKKLYIPGMNIPKVYRKVCRMMQDEMIGLGLFSVQDIQNEPTEFACVKKYFMHGVAHFIGLDVHDVGEKETIFDYGMVLSCEPGIYIPEEGIGIRIETMMLVNDIPVDLMPDIPLTIKEIEKQMKDLLNI